MYTLPSVGDDFEYNILADTTDPEQCEKYLGSEEFPGEMLCTTKAYADENPEVCQKVVNALIDAQAWIAEHTDEEVAASLKPLFGDIDEGVIASIFCIPCNALIYSYGLYLIAKENDKYCFSIKEIINPCTAVSIFAILLIFMPLKVPEVLVQIVGTLGNMSTPLALIVLGIVIADTFYLGIFKKKLIYYFCFIKLILAPVLIKIILLFLSIDYKNIHRVLIVTAALPVSNVVVILCENYQNDREIATEYVSISTICFLI